MALRDKDERHDIAQRLRMVLSGHGLDSYEEVGAFFGIRRGTVKNWLNGVAIPPILAMKPLVDAGYSTDWVFFNVGTAKRTAFHPAKAPQNRVSGGVA